MKKSLIITICIVTLIIFIIVNIIIKNNYKTKKFVNNISNKTLEECEKYILNISSYETTAEVTIQSNKNINKYIIYQKYIKDKETIQEIIEPEIIKGTKFSYKDNELIMENTNLNLKDIYKNYPYISDNCLFLSDFISIYFENKPNNKTKIENDNNNLILTVSMENNSNEKLYINLKNGKPEKMVKKDKNEKEIIYISYNEIKINE